MRSFPVALCSSLLLAGAGSTAAQVTERTGSIWQETTFIGRTVGAGLVAPLDWSAHDWLRVGGGAAALGVLSLADGEVRDFARRNRGALADDVAREAKPYGRIGSAAVVGLFLGGGLVLNDARARAVAIDALAASVLTSAFVVPAFQAASGRSRPWHDEGTHAFHPFKGRHSFPSGHTAQAFVVATVIAQHYDASWVDAAAYTGAGLVAASRIYHDAHHLSDVVTSAVIATAIGRWVVRRGSAERGSILVQPAVVGRTAGIAISF
ncbi:MAG: phosphatase PAP2 family protein [Longimicrobiales bacterium]